MCQRSIKIEMSVSIKRSHHLNERLADEQRLNSNYVHLSASPVFPETVRWEAADFTRGERVDDSTIIPCHQRQDVSCSRWIIITSVILSLISKIDLETVPSFVTFSIIEKHSLRWFTHFGEYYSHSYTITRAQSTECCDGRKDWFLQPRF